MAHHRLCGQDGSDAVSQDMIRLGDLDTGFRDKPRLRRVALQRPLPGMPGFCRAVTQLPGMRGRLRSPDIPGR
jgi:hypothetical protein